MGMIAAMLNPDISTPFTFLPNDAVLIQHASPEYGEMLKATEPVHTAYCRRHLIDYGREFDVKDSPGVWSKVRAIRAALERGYAFVIWLDADCLIVNQEADLRCGCPPCGIGMTRHAMDWGQLAPTAYDHLNVGAMYFRNTPQVLEVLQAWMEYPTHGHQWAEQHSLNELLKERPGVAGAIGARWNSTPPYFESTNGEVVRAWHGLGRAPMRTQVVKSAVANLMDGGRGVESPYWRCRIRCEELWREKSYGMRKKAA